MSDTCSSSFQTEPSRGEETVDMRGGERKTGGYPSKESGERGSYRSEEEEREIPHRVRLRELYTEDAGAR